MPADDVGEPAPRPHDTATRRLNPWRAMCPTAHVRDGGWTARAATRPFAPPRPTRGACQAVHASASTARSGRGTDRRAVCEPRRSLRTSVVTLDPNASSDETMSHKRRRGIIVLGRRQPRLRPRGRQSIMSVDAGAQGDRALSQARVRVHRRRGPTSATPAPACDPRRAPLMKHRRRTASPSHRGQAISVRGEKAQRSANARQLYPHVVSHVGIHARLEETMTTHDYGTSKRSPGDLDALSLGCADMVPSSLEPQRLASDDYYDGV